MEYSLMDDNYCGISLISTLKEFTNAELIHVKLIFGAIIFADFFQIRKNLFRKIFSKSALRKNQFHKMFQNVFFKTQHLFFRITESTKERFDQKLKSRQEGQEIIKNGWHQALHRQSNTVSAVAAYQCQIHTQEIDPMESYVSFGEHQHYLSADRKRAKCFFV